jgi:hypothetical protein
MRVKREDVKREKAGRLITFHVFTFYGHPFPVTERQRRVRFPQLRVSLNSCYHKH